MSANMDEAFEKIIDEIADGYIEYISTQNEELKELPDDDPLIVEKRNKYIKELLDMGEEKYYIYIGDAFQRGTNVKKDIDTAYACYKMAIEKGEYFGHVCIAQMLFENGLYKDRMEEIMERLVIAESNDCLFNAGLYLLGNIYYNGYLGKPNFNKAYNYFHSIIDDNDNYGDCYFWKAHYRLGQIFEQIAKDYKEDALDMCKKEYETEEDIEKELDY